MLACDLNNYPGEKFRKKNGFADVQKVPQGENMLVVAQRSIKFTEEEV